ncbi:outer membrane lipid asymmetry maintenance protein MlaD [Candidatus Marithrix sp. Canyon 246]|uniref:outer membrane lipid asymmetry maintenance protein MlaD n=1 Tax=Candidatus Marithrix sp. Canyon 246 TaxID=1827136 RepID=UPI00084A1FF5|nr:outer membrane lipid asymmetry maintenance protein MlaD [Candidatus Marithrix sp. Canyon 246]
MQIKKTVEIWVGILVVLGFAALFMLSMKVSHLGDLFIEDGYSIIASFDNIGGLKVKSSVKMGGVRIGRVSNIRFDNKNYEAVVTMQIESQYNTIPTDTSASILTAGLLGEQYIGLEAGAEEEYLTKNTQIESGLTQSAVILEQLIGKFLYNSAENGTKKQTN